MQSYNTREEWLQAALVLLFEMVFAVLVSHPPLGNHAATVCPAASLSGIVALRRARSCWVRHSTHPSVPMAPWKCSSIHSWMMLSRCCVSDT